MYPAAAVRATTSRMCSSTPHASWTTMTAGSGSAALTGRTTSAVWCLPASSTHSRCSCTSGRPGLAAQAVSGQVRLHRVDQLATEARSLRLVLLGCQGDTAAPPGNPRRLHLGDDGPVHRCAHRGVL